MFIAAFSSSRDRKNLTSDLFFILLKLRTARIGCNTCVILNGIILVIESGKVGLFVAGVVVAGAAMTANSIVQKHGDAWYTDIMSLIAGVL
jgi:hypothetical protein